MISDKIYILVNRDIANFASLFFVNVKIKLEFIVERLQINPLLFP